MDGDSCKSALFQLHILFYITQIVLMAILAPVAFLVGLASILSRSSHLGSILPIILMMISVQHFPIPGLIHLNLKLSPWWLSRGDFILVISFWWFRDQLTLLIIPWKALLVLSIFSYGTLLLHATCILFLSFLTVISFLTVTSLSTMALGPLLDASDRCVGCFSLKLLRGRLHRAPGNCCFSPTMCYYSLW